MSNKTSFLHQPNGETVAFTTSDNGTVYVQWQQTLDPNEELNDETMGVDAARTLWRDLRAKGYKVATYWHACKRDWTDNRD